MAIENTLERNRVEELDQLLSLLKPKLLEYIEKADPHSDKYEADSLGTVSYTHLTLPTIYPV